MGVEVNQRYNFFSVLAFFNQEITAKRSLLCRALEGIFSDHAWIHFTVGFYNVAVILTFQCHVTVFTLTCFSGSKVGNSRWMATRSRFVREHQWLSSCITHTSKHLHILCLCFIFTPLVGESKVRIGFTNHAPNRISAVVCGFSSVSNYQKASLASQADTNVSPWQPNDHA